MTEDYVNVVGDLMYPKTTFGPYGYAPENGRVCVYFVEKCFIRVLKCEFAFVEGL